MVELIREFKTARFTVRITAEEDFDLDLSFDDTGEVAEKLESGEYTNFCAKAECLLDGNSIASDYLGGCIYANIADFQDHRGMNKKGHGSYFSDMVRTVCREGREHVKTLRALPSMRLDVC